MTGFRLNRSYSSAIKDIVLGARHDCHDPADQFLTQFEFSQGGLEVFGNGGKIRFPKVEIRMGLSHVFSGPGGRGTQCGGEKGFLFLVLSFHVHVLEEVVDPLIGENFHVEEIHRSAQGCLAPDLLVEARGTFRLEFFQVGFGAESVGDSFVFGFYSRFCRGPGVEAFQVRRFVRHSREGSSQGDGTDGGEETEGSDFSDHDDLGFGWVIA